jgi:hypothetical protein
MTRPTGDSAAPPSMHRVIMFQMAVSISCAILIIFSKWWPDTSVATLAHTWIERSAGAIRILLFFEPWPSEENATAINEGMQAHRHVLAMSLLIAFCSIMGSRPYWPHWSAILNAKLKMAGFSAVNRAEILRIGHRRMVIAVAATAFLALFGQPQEKDSIAWFYSSDWTLMRAPLLIGIASAFVLLAATFRLSANDPFSRLSIRR